MTEEEYRIRQIELLEQIAKSINDVNIKTDKMIIVMKSIATKTEGMLN